MEYVGDQIYFGCGEDLTEYPDQTDPEKFPGRFLCSTGRDSGQCGLCHLRDGSEHGQDAVRQPDIEEYVCQGADGP